MRTILILLLTMASIGISTSQAQPAWYTTEVGKIGVAGNGKILIQLSDRNGSAFTNKWFSIKPTVSREMMALGLTATTNDRQLQVNVDVAQKGWPIINAIYMRPAD